MGLAVLAALDARAAGSERDPLRPGCPSWQRHFDEVAAPPGVAPVVARLDALLNAVTPVDWEAVRYWGEQPSLYRVGVRAGVDFQETVPAAEGIAMLLNAAEGHQPGIEDTSSGPSWWARSIA